MAVEHRETLVKLARSKVKLLERVRFSAEVLIVYAWVRWLVLRRGAVPAVVVLRRGVQEGVGVETEFGRSQLESALRCGRAVVKVLHLLPTDSRCLMRSLVLTAILARRGVYSKVVIGVRGDPSFAAHAWVELHGQALLPSDESTYQRLVEL